MESNKCIIGIILLLSVTCLHARDSKYTRHGSGPMYWMAYEECYVTDRSLSEERYRKSVDWVAENFRSYGFDMICTDGWIEGAQTIDENGYVTQYNSAWKKGFSYWVEYNRQKGLKTGVYYNPLWITRKAYNANCPIKGSNRHVRDIKGTYNFNDWLYFVDVDKEGAEQWIKGYVRHFINLGMAFLRVDFLCNYENHYGTQKYVKALRWMAEEAGDEIALSLVMPNCHNHAANELLYGDLFRISEDVFKGGWDFISERRRGIPQDRWAKWGNAFDGFVDFSNVASRGQMIMDGDFIRLNTCKTDEECRFWISLMIMTGSPIAIADQYDTIGDKGRFYQNEELLVLNKRGFCGRPLSTNTEDRNSQKWMGQLPDGSWIVGLFNRDNNSVRMSVNLKNDLGIMDGSADNVRDLWEHTDLGKCQESYTVDVPPHGCRMLKFTIVGSKCFQAEVAAVRGAAMIKR